MPRALPTPVIAVLPPTSSPTVTTDRVRRLTAPCETCLPPWHWIWWCWPVLCEFCYEGRLINIHPSILPSFKGLDTHRQALEAGVKVHGCTVHAVTPELDHGPILAQAVVPVLPTDTPEQLADRVLRAEHRLYPMTIAAVLSGRLRWVQGRWQEGAARFDHGFTPCLLDANP